MTDSDGLCQRFAAHAAAAPDAPAVIAGSTMTTYGELAAEVERAAGVLAARGVRPDQVVGIALERSRELVAAILAVLRLGATYLPLDLAHPVAHRDGMLADAGATALVTTEGRTPAGISVVSPSTWRDGAPEPPPAPPGHRDRLAYVIFTSGSTGRPKGVRVTVRNVLNFVDARDYVALTPADRVMLNASPAFDVMTFEVWSTLCNGACLVVVPRADAADPRRLGKVVTASGATTTFLTTAYFREIATRSPEVLAPLAQVLVGGEALDAASVTRARAACPRTRFVNVYGPTEATTFVTWYEIPGTGPIPDPPPLGVALAGTTATVCDEWLRPVRPGIEGELCLGGGGVALGYVGHPALTADRFVPDPDGSGRRRYRTGDRAVLRADGLLEFRGRYDDQVKIRGFRVATGDVEVLLADQPDVAAAAVTVWDTEADDRRLVASVVRLGTTDVPDREWANGLRRRLLAEVPEFLVPAHVVVCAALPRTAQGKLDRQAAHRAAIAAIGAAHPADPVPNSDPHVRLVSEVWAEVLRHPIRPAENFFDAGGNSLLLLQVHDLLQQRLGQPVELIDLLEHPTVPALAAALRERAQ